MARIPFSTGKGWFPRVFPGFVGPTAVDDTVVLTSPQEGTHRYADLLKAAGSGDASSEVAAGTNPPGDKMWLVPYCGAYHLDDTPLSTHLWIVLQSPAGDEYPIAAVASAGDKQRLAVDRPFIVPPRWSVRVKTATATGVGKSLNILMTYAEIPIGEYVPPV